MWKIKLGIIVGGVVLAFWGFKENKLNSNTSKDPQKVTVAELEKGDYSGSNYVTITDFYQLNAFGVYSAEVPKYEKDPNANSKVQYAYIPALQLEHPFIKAAMEYMSSEDPNLPEPQLKDYSVLIRTEEFKTVGGFNNAPPLEKVEKGLTGLIINKVKELDGEEKKLILDASPNLDLSKVLIIEQGRTPTSPMNAYLAMGAGVLLIIGGAVWLIKGLKS